MLYLDCGVCSRLFVRNARGRPTDVPRCGPECDRAWRARAHREAYAGHDRLREYRQLLRESWTDGDRQRRRAADRAAGYRPSKRAADQRRRARKLGATVEDFDPLEVFERDGWICGICCESIDSDLGYPAPRSPSLDHVVPLSLGGAHSRANTRASHLICNVRRGNRVDVAQLHRLQPVTGT